MSDSLEAGFCVAVAPGFFVSANWADRIAVNSGTEFQKQTVVPKPDWRPATPAELAILTGDAPIETGVQIFRLSEELRQRWWKTTESVGLAGDSDAYPAYARQVLDFLHSHGIPVSPETTCEAAITVPDQRTTRDGLELSVDVRRGGGVIGGVNLGDEPASLVFLNLPPAALHTRIESQDRWLAKNFFEAYPDYPLVKLLLEPGDGYLLTPGGIIFDHWTVGQKEVGVLVLLRSLG